MITRPVLRALTESIRAVAGRADLGIGLRAKLRIGGTRWWIETNISQEPTTATRVSKPSKSASAKQPAILNKIASYPHEPLPK